MTDAIRQIRRRVFEILEVSRHGDPWSRVVDWCIIALIVSSAVVIVASTVPAQAARFGTVFTGIERATLVVFALEYALRLWVSVERLEARGQTPLRARLAYMVTPFALIDLAAVVPALVEWATGGGLEFLLLLRLLRLFKLARYSTALDSLIRVLRSELKALAAAGFVMVIMVFMAATVMYVIERHAQPAAFGSIPAAMWWSVVTLATLGYGDVVPVTLLGKLVAGLVIMGGLAFFAIPIGIIASGFTNEMHRQDFLVRWEMVARVPLFRNLDARTIGEISHLLRTRRVRRGEAICRVGTPSEGLFFLVDGRARARRRRKTWWLGAGDFFGELALLHDAPHEISVVADTPCRLLILDPLSFEDILSDHPEVRQVLQEVLTERLGDLSEPAEVAHRLVTDALTRWGHLDPPERD
ncbi:ion transporter [Parapedomonas caeni]